MSASTSTQGATLHVPQVQRILPGPAGQLQQLAAAGALGQATPEVLGLRDNTGISTAANPCLHDPCFQSSVWSAAKQYAQQQAAHGLEGQLHTVKMAKEIALGKVPLMLLMLGSFQPSGVGSAFCKVKDPTGSMGAALHSSVLQQQSQLGPSCVLLLQQVSVFTPAPGTSYLAVTAHNIIKVWGAEPTHDRIRNAFHQQQQQQQQQPAASQQGSQYLTQTPLLGNHQQQRQQQQQGQLLGHRQQGTVVQQEGSSSGVPQQQQQQQESSGPIPRQTQLPPPSPHLPALIDRPAHRPGMQQQQLTQQCASLQQQQQQQQVSEQQADFSPAVTNPRHIQQPSPTSGWSAESGQAHVGQKSYQQQQGTPNLMQPLPQRQQLQPQRHAQQQQHEVIARANSAGNSSMPPPPSRMQPSSLSGQLQKLRQAQQQQQTKQPQASQQQQRSSTHAAAPFQSGAILITSGEQCASGAPISLSLGQQQQQQRSQPAPAALLGDLPNSAAQNSAPVGTNRSAAIAQQQPPPAAKAPTARTCAGSLVTQNTPDDAVDDVVAAIFGSQLGGGMPAAAAAPTPHAPAAAATAIFGSQLAAGLRSSPHITPQAPALQQRRQQQESGAASGTTAAGAALSHKRFKPSGVEFNHTMLSANTRGSADQSGWASQQKQQSFQQAQQPHHNEQTQSNASGGLFSGLFNGFQPQQQQHSQSVASVSGGPAARGLLPSQLGSAKAPAVRAFGSALGRQPAKQVNLLDDLLGDELDDFDM